MSITAHHPLVKLSSGGPEQLSPFRIARTDLATLALLRKRLRLNGHLGEFESTYWTAELRELLCRVLESAGAAAADGGGAADLVTVEADAEQP